jgi:hypothetical protein
MEDRELIAAILTAGTLPTLPIPESRTPSGAVTDEEGDLETRLTVCNISARPPRKRSQGRKAASFTLGADGGGASVRAASRIVNLADSARLFPAPLG